MCGEPVLSCTANSASKAGTYDISVQAGTLHTASELKLENGVLTINKVQLTVSCNNYTKKQGDPMPTFAIQYSGFVKGENENALTKKPTATCSATASSAPGTYPIVVSGGESPNYSFNYKNGTLTVVAADAIVVTAKSYTIKYGDALPAFDYDVAGAGLQGKPVVTCNAGTRPSPGVYDIIVSKGSVSNYNVTYVNGTLTVLKAPLNVSVGNYTKYSDEENPTFEIRYSGFKYGETAYSLTKRPVTYCEARKGSPAGTYPIVVSGGESPNYEFNYTDGTLTVKAVYGLNISSIGNGKVVYDGNSISSYAHYTVREGQRVSLKLEPDDGYELASLTQNGTDVTGRVSSYTYTIGNVKEDINIVATFVENQGIFRVGSIRYRILSAPAKTAIVDKYAYYKGHVVIPSEVLYKGDTWKVVGMADNAFNNCTGLISVELPSTMEYADMGISLFTGCTSLAAVTWNCTFVPSRAILGIIDNPNLLFYTSNSSYAPTGINNVVVDGKAARILLQDVEGAANFYCPKSFTAVSISYTHNYSMTSAIGGIQGWETLALPFTVTKIEHSVHGSIVPFAKYNGQGRPFWLYTYGAAGFARAQGIEANKPYLICMPNNEEYDVEYRLGGDVTFSAQDARVEATENATGLHRNNRTFMPAFCQEDKSNEVFALNVVNKLHGETEGYAPGSVFISGLRNVSPFEAFMTTGSAQGRMTIEIDFDQSTDIDDLLASCHGAACRELKVYNLNGQVVVSADNALELQKAVKRLSTGIYIINGKKIQIK